MRTVGTFGERPKGSARANREGRARLLRRGDDGRSPRHIVHCAYPDPAAGPVAAAELAKALSARGFTVEAAPASDGLILNHVAAVSGPGFDALTRELAQWLRAHGWRYDGWECRAVAAGPGRG